jgi:pyruvate formate lyase activating enzyme
MKKREFIRGLGIAAAGIGCLGSRKMIANNSEKAEGLWKWSKESMFSEVTPRGIKCLVCPNECILQPGDTSYCRNRVNFHGKLYSIAYGNPCAIHVDPIEKKPFYHFLPGSKSFSIATAGCNFSCLNCQNWSISQTSPKKTQNYDLMPAAVLENANKNVCKSIAYTYTEPVTFYEYVYDSAFLARQAGIKNVLVSNGYINEKPLRQLCKFIDAATIDLKSFDDNTYIRLNAGGLKPVLNSLKVYKEEGVWLEISNLVIPSWSDDLDMIKRMCDWLYQNGFQDTPLHFLRFQPLYKLNQLAPTPVNVLLKAREIASASGIKYIYIGNTPGNEVISTFCPKCKKMIVERKGHLVVSNKIANGKCSYCTEKIAGHWH